VRQVPVTVHIVCMPEECAIKYVGIRSETDISDVGVLCTHMHIANDSH